MSSETFKPGDTVEITGDIWGPDSRFTGLRAKVRSVTPTGEVDQVDIPYFSKYHMGLGPECWGLLFTLTKVAETAETADDLGGPEAA